jgi:methylmalonyl-CoA mutase N-terminal domain/subunit
MKTDATLGERQTERLNDLKKVRDASLVTRTLSEIEVAAKEGANLFPFVIEAVRARATLGEIMGVLKNEFGTYTAPSGF